MEARCEAVRKREWRARRRRELRQVCAACDAIFNPRRADAKFCGAACRQKGHRRRKAGGEMATTRLTGAPWRVSAPVRRRSPGSSPRRLSGPSCAARTAGSSTWRASSAEAQNSIGPPEKFRKTFADLSSVSPDMKGAPEVYGARRNEPPFRNPKETKDDATAQHVQRRRLPAFGTVTVSGRASTLTSALWPQASQAAVTARTPFFRMF